MLGYLGLCFSFASIVAAALLVWFYRKNKMDQHCKAKNNDENRKLDENTGIRKPFGQSCLPSPQRSQESCQSSSSSSFDMLEDKDEADPEVLSCPGTVPLLVEVHGKLELKEGALEQLLNPAKLGNHPIAVVSIAGAFRMGKSFILNLFLRYFQTKGWKQKNGPWLKGWKSSESGGFKWKGGAEGDTRGILAWSEPIIVEKKDGSKLAVILLDTQGNFEHGRKKEENVGIFALSTLFSSLQIFNISKQIQTNDLEYLQCFVEFSKVAHPKKTSNVDTGAGDHQICFFDQDLMFLVRDWQNPVSHAYGKNGGKDYLKRTSSPSFDVQADDYLRAAFSSIQCYLMPEPSTKVRITQMEGQILTSDDIGEEFSKQLGDLVDEYLHPDKLRPKSVGFYGKVTADQLLKHVKDCAKMILSGEKPEFPSIMQLIASHANKIALENVEETYIAEAVKAIENMEKPSWDEFEKMLKREHDRARRTFLERTSFARKEVQEKDLKSFEFRIKNALPTVKVRMEQKRCAFVQEEIKMWTKESEEKLKFRELPYTNIGELKKIEDERLQLLITKENRDPDTVLIHRHVAKAKLNACCNENIRDAKQQNIAVSRMKLLAIGMGIGLACPFAIAGFLSGSATLGSGVALGTGILFARNRIRSGYEQFSAKIGRKKEKMD